MEELDSDSDIDLYIDEDSQLHDLEQLRAALEDDEPSSLFTGASASASVDTLNQLSLPSTSSAEAAQEHAKIDSALGLNKLLDEKLKRLEKVLVGRLNECRQRLSDLHNAPSADKHERQETFRYVNCGKPYFRDKSNFPAPDNEDTILMAESNMYDFSEITSVPGWTVKDKTSFKNLLLKMSIDIKKKELTSKISQLKRDSAKRKPKQLEKAVDAVNREILALSTKTLEQVALPLEQEYDWEMVANKLNRRHSASEYRSLWRVFLHPSIKKNKWDKAEHTRLQEIAHHHNLQDWDAIAKELNTGRTGYQCFVYFRTNMGNSFAGKKWTKEEEEYLRRLIEYYKEDEYIPWGKVASAMENRTKIQVYNKYFRLIEKRKGRFLPEEDAVILTCLDKFGLNFKRMSEYLPGRSVSQIRLRYSVLAKKRISAVWTVQEDKKLLQIMANEDSITNYASVTNHFPGKTRVHVRARYITLGKWMKSHPNATLENAPRRGARRLGHGLASDNLNKAMEKLKKRLETEIQHRNSRRITSESPLEVIEDAILANLVTEQIKEEERRKLEVYEEDQMMVLNNETHVSAQSLNATNLQKLIIFLRGKLKRELFEKSNFANQYPELLDTQQQVSLFQVKCYSKKKFTTPTAEPVKLRGTADIWGTNTLSSLTYVLPPHYATITGCRKLMSYVNAIISKDNGSNPLNVNALMKRNSSFKEQMFLLMERFNSLFLYPMLLSNKGPEQVGKVSSRDYQAASSSGLSEKLKNGRVYMSHSHSVYIPNMPDTMTGVTHTDGRIDLEAPAPDQKEKTCVKKVVVDEKAFRFVTDNPKR